MKLIDQICSLELSKRLEKLGIKQESVFYWVQNSQNNWVLRYINYQHDEIDREIFLEGYPDAISAFTVAELGEMLPFLIEYNNKKYWYHTGKGNKNNKYYDEHEVDYTDGGEAVIHLERGNTEADARAKMLIYLLENKLYELHN